VNIKRLHTIQRRPLVCANRQQVTQPRRAGIIHWWHPKTPKTDEIIDDDVHEPDEKQTEEKPESPAEGSKALPVELEPSRSPFKPPNSSTTQLPISLQSKEHRIPRKPKYGYTLNLGQPKSAEDMSRKTRDGVDMDTERYVKWGARRVVVPTVIEDFRRTMRALPGPIVVLTAANYHEGAPNVYRGITISSFSSLSMSPDPLVTFNIKSEMKAGVKPSRALRILRKAPHFLVHIIDDTPEGVRLANFFATVHDQQFTPEAQEKAGFEVEELTGFRHTLGTPLILPRLRGKGISRVLRCEILRGGVCVPGYDILGPNIVDHESEPRNKLYQSSDKRSIRRGFIRIGDHVLCIAKVLEVMENDTLIPSDARSGLGYMDGKYRTAGEVIEVPTSKSSFEDKS